MYHALLPVASGPRLVREMLNAPMMDRRTGLVIAVLVLAGCAAAPEPVKPPPAPAPEPEPVEAPPEPQVIEPPPRPVAPVLTGTAAREQAQKLLRQAFDSLNDGNEQKARGELEEIKQLDPDNKQAACLMRGITADPVTTLGRDSTPYTVRPGDLLGRIAQRALGDVCEFYILARYNQIRVPKALAAGQVIRIPGKGVLAPEVPAAKPVPEPAPPPPAPVAKPAGPDPAVIKAAEEKKRQALIDRHHRNAQAAFRRQDLATAIREWDRVLEIDPANELAQARKQEALELSRRLKQIK